MNHLIREADELLKNGGFQYAVCGGFAIELFLDKTVRNHGDIDISAFWDERDKIILYMQSLGWSVYELCGGGMAHYITDVSNQLKTKRNIFCMTNDCSIVSLTPTNEADMFVVDFDHNGQEHLTFIEFLFNNAENGRFLYARNHAVFLPLARAILSRDGIQYLAPEMVLLYKSTDTERDGYQFDYDAAMEMMSDEQKKWLHDALTVMNPAGHKWLTNWYHGSLLELTELSVGSTITRWRELAEAFSHKPPMLAYDSVGGTIHHNGQQNGFLYIVDEPIAEDTDIYKHPRTTMDDGVEWLTKHPLRLRRIGETRTPILSFDEFVKLRNVEIRSKDHERIVRMFFPYLTSICGIPEALSAIIGKITGVDFSGTSIVTGCFNGINDESIAPYDSPDLYCKWDDGKRVYMYGTIVQGDLSVLKEDEHVLFALSNKITDNIERTADRHIYMRNDVE